VHTHAHTHDHAHTHSRSRTHGTTRSVFLARPKKEKERGE